MSIINLADYSEYRWVSKFKKDFFDNKGKDILILGIKMRRNLFTCFEKDFGKEYGRINSMFYLIYNEETED